MKKLLPFALVLTLLTGWSVPAIADELKNAQQQKSAIDKKINSMIQEKREVQQEKKVLESEKKSIETKQAKENQEYQDLIEQLELLNQEIAKIDASIAEAERNYNEHREKVETRLKVMYKNMDGSASEMLFKSSSLVDFFERLEAMSLIAKNDKQLIESLASAKKDVEFKRQLKEAKKQQLEKATSDKQEQLNKLTISRAELEARIKKTQAELNNLEKKIDELNKESERIMQEINRLTKKRSFVGGTWIWPLPSSKSVVSDFGMRRHPILKKYKMHNGIDIDGNTGDSIVAANKGTVIIAGWQNGYGNCVVIDHGGGITSLYAHCSKLCVKVGDEVKAEQVIAKVGSTGLATGPHLHFEVRKNGKPQDPLQYVSR